MIGDPTQTLVPLSEHLPPVAISGEHVSRLDCFSSWADSPPVGLHRGATFLANVIQITNSGRPVASSVILSPDASSVIRSPDALSVVLPQRSYIISGSR
jgi:hypothetical protein